MTKKSKKQFLKSRSDYVAFEKKPTNDYHNDPFSSVVSYISRNGGLNKSCKSISVVKKTVSFEQKEIPLKSIMEVNDIIEKFGGVLRTTWTNIADDNVVIPSEYMYWISGKNMRIDSRIDSIKEMIDRFRNDKNVIFARGGPGCFVTVFIRDINYLAKWKMYIDQSVKLTYTDISEVSEAAKEINKIVG